MNTSRPDPLYRFLRQSVVALVMVLVLAVVALFQCASPSANEPSPRPPTPTYRTEPLDVSWESAGRAVRDLWEAAKKAAHDFQRGFTEER